MKKKQTQQFSKFFLKDLKTKNSKNNDDNSTLYDFLSLNLDN